MKKALMKNKWYQIPVKMPIPYSEILFFDVNGIEHVGTMNPLNQFINSAGYKVKNVIAWMPAPKPFEIR